MSRFSAKIYIGMVALTLAASAFFSVGIAAVQTGSAMAQASVQPNDLQSIRT